jgi:regulator of protease activity HflC (stomatin/prohibitin superfamily)
MSTALLVGLGVAVLVVLILAAAAVHVLPEYERGVIFRLGRIQALKGPGLIFIIPAVDRLTRVTLRTQTYDVPPQDIITRDNVTVRVNAVTYFNVIDAIRSVLSIDDYRFGTQQIAQTTLRSILGQTSLDDLLTKRDEVNQRLQQVIDSVTDPWGVKVTIVEVKDVILPEGMRRAMARQAESERDRRAKVIHALGEKEAAANLGEAAVVLEAHPAALQLRVLSTLLEVGSEHNSTIAFPIPMEFLRTLDPSRVSAVAGNGRPDAAPSATAPPSPTAPPTTAAPVTAPPDLPGAAASPVTDPPATVPPVIPPTSAPPDSPPASAAA